MKNLFRRLTTVIVSVGPVLVFTGCASTHTLLDGREKSFVIVGYSTSFAWPDMLQDMLDDHAGGHRKYHVLNATIGGAAVARWIGEPDSDSYKRTMTPMLRDYWGHEARLRADAPQPKIALCQQSLQFTRTQRGPIASVDDRKGIEIGADALEKLAVRLHDHGIDRVYYGMHIYKKPIEPEVGNERLALDGLLSRGHNFIFQGPDVWTRTRDEYPDAFTNDRVHPNERGMKIMAEGWYRTVAGRNARDDVVDRMHARSYNVVDMMDAYMASRRGE